MCSESAAGTKLGERRVVETPVEKVLGRIASLERGAAVQREQADRHSASLDRVFRTVERLQTEVSDWPRDRARLVETLDRHNKLIAEAQIAYRTLADSVVKTMSRIRAEQMAAETDAARRHTEFLLLVREIQQQQFEQGTQIAKALQLRVQVGKQQKALTEHRQQEGLLTRGMVALIGIAGTACFWIWARWDAGDWVVLKNLGDKLFRQP